MHLNFTRPNLGKATRFSAPSGRLQKLNGLGSNPGNLNAWFYEPEHDLSEKLPLVVVLHGCTQTASGYDHGSGWSELASANGFATLFAEQQRANNPNLCFNWFQPGDTRRAAGEALSIAQMIEVMIEQHSIDRERVYITGLSAGGAMTSVMLATYPEIFAGGAIIAGLPYGAASGVPEALQQMGSHSPSARTTGRWIRQASQHNGPWPPISVWHGTADTVVSPSNADAIVRQWQEVHEISPNPHETTQVGEHQHRRWRADTGKLLIEDYRISRMGHGTPLASRGEDGCGRAGSFMLEVGISSTVESARTWGLLKTGSKDVQSRGDTRHIERQIPSAPFVGTAIEPAGKDRITRVIEDALRTAGLMK